MSFPVKSVLAAALTLSSFTAAVASGVSGAEEAPGYTGSQPVTISSSLPSAASAATVQTVRFAPLKEVVQPLGSRQMDTPTGDAASDTPRAGDLIAVPDKDYASLAEMVRDVDTTAALDKDTHCLATAIFYESRSESLEGQLAVGRVIVNRADSNRFGKDMCSVIAQRGQFSFVRGGVIPEPNTRRPAWKTAIAIALIAQDNAWTSKAEGALYFHARRVAPGWRHSKVAVIDNHIFYR
ncbi:MAG: cell wall hydrolase [Sphingobium sp.]